VIVIVSSRVQAAGQVSELLARHRAPGGAEPSLEDVILTYMRGATTPALETTPEASK
jgi:hypothetical protein